LEPQHLPSRRRQSWRGEVRTQLLISSALSATVFFLLSFPLTAWLTRHEVENREKQRLNSARLTFQSALSEFRTEQGKLTPTNIESFFTSLLSNVFPDDDTFLIAIAGSSFYAASPKALPDPVRPGSTTLKRWLTAETTEKGILNSNDAKIGSILYELIPIKEEDRKLGSLAVVISTAGEYEEASEVTQLIQRWYALLFLVSLLILWLRASTLTRPLRRLTTAIADIHSGNLTSRLAIQGDDELAIVGQRFNAMLDQIEALVSSQREFIRDVSHELRTPITIIRGHTELLIIEPKENQQETIRLLLEEIDHMARIVGDLSLLARSDRPEFLQLACFPLRSFLEDVYRKTWLLAPRDWQLDCPGNLEDAIIVGDPQRLTQCLMNLLVNASQHTQEHARITLGGVHTSDGWVKLWVSDQGKGIPPEMHRRIFERFQRGKRSQADEQGSGLGLAIVEAVARAHGGRVELESRVGRGSTFTIYIPQLTPFYLNLENRKSTPKRFMQGKTSKDRGADKSRD
jgi:two-component system, OmpR family, sensor kinase